MDDIQLMINIDHDMAQQRIASGYEPVFDIWFSVNEDFAFPMQNWSDFGVPLLAAWINNFEILRHKTVSIKWSFMDGPYRVSISHFAITGKIDLEFVARGQRKGGTTHITYKHLYHILLNAVTIVEESLSTDELYASHQQSMQKYRDRLLLSKK